MGKSIIIKLSVIAVASGLAWFSPTAFAQETPKVQQPRQQMGVSDKDLVAFAKSYVQFHKIRAEYEPAILNTNDPQEKGRIEREALTKFGKAVESQGLTLESYARIFQTVSADEQLREKALKLIEAERKGA